MEDLSDLKAGDKVIQIYRNWYGTNESVRTVEKITPSGLIKVGGVLYYKNGLRRGQYGSEIKRYSKEEEDRINLEALERKTKDACKNVFDKCRNNLTYEQAVAILKILKGE